MECLSEAPPTLEALACRASHACTCGAVRIVSKGAAGSVMDWEAREEAAVPLRVGEAASCAAVVTKRPVEGLEPPPCPACMCSMPHCG